MESIILGWYVMVHTGSVLLLTVFGSPQRVGAVTRCSAAGRSVRPPRAAALGSATGGRRATPSVSARPAR